MPPLIPERKRTLFQMLRIERHFEKKLNKLAAAKDEAEKEQPKSRTSSSLNTMRFRQL